MVKYLLASHGKFSEGTESFLKIMTGTIPTLTTLTAFLDDRPVGELVTEKLKEIGDFDQLLVFCDLHGGSVAQELFRQTAQDPRNIQIIAGYNLALVLDLILTPGPLGPDQIRQSIRQSQQAIVYLNDLPAKKETSDLF